MLVGCAARGLDLIPDGVGDGEGDAGGGGHWTAASRRRLLLVNGKWGLWLRCARELFDVLMQTRVEEEPEPPDRGCVVRLTSGSAALFAFFPPFFVRRAVLNLAETA